MFKARPEILYDFLGIDKNFLQISCQKLVMDGGLNINNAYTDRILKTGNNFGHLLDREVFSWVHSYNMI